MPTNQVQKGSSSSSSSDSTFQRGERIDKDSPSVQGKNFLKRPTQYRHCLAEFLRLITSSKVFVDFLTCLRNFLNHFKWESFSFFSSLSPSPQKLKCPPALPPFSLLEDFLGGLGESLDSTVEGWRVVSFDRGEGGGGQRSREENNLFFPPRVGSFAGEEEEGPDSHNQTFLLVLRQRFSHEKKTDKYKRRKKRGERKPLLIITNGL